MPANLDIRLFRADDDEEDLFAKQIIQAVINGSSTPAQAAAQIEQWVFEEQEKAWLAVEGKSLDEIEGPIMAVGPNPRGYYSMLLSYIAPVCSAYPPGHAAQESLLAFIVELRNLPDQEMHQWTVVHNYALEHSEASIEIITRLWKEHGSIHQAFQNEFRDIDHPFSNVDTPGSETLIRYTNLQGFIARLTTSDNANFVYCCSFLRILPSAQFYPDLEKYKKGGPRRIAGYLQAGVPWMANAEATRRMFEESRRRENDDDIDDWKARHWEGLKIQLVFIASKLEFAEEDKLLGQKTRALAVELRDRMDQFR